jgi:DNA replication protein DnaC
MNEPRHIGSAIDEVRKEWIKAGIVPADYENRPRRVIDIEAEKRRARRHKLAHRWKECCPRLYKHSDWNHPKLARYTQQIEQVRHWKVGPRGLLITGPSGRGKTRSMWDLLRRLLCRESVDVRIWNSQDFFQTMQEQINYGRDESRSWVDAMARIPVLAIDDWGQEAVTNARSEWAQATFFRLLELRMGEGRPLIVTTNLTARQIAGNDQGGLRSDPLLRRLLEACEVVRFEEQAA